ncbi:MAG: gamma carbonic anhydrase family protein [Desulfobulbaceae bacterium]|jgi:carbonic anhydrase/acetyltransferase-like protein (isoleucine patch superfamily)|nr:gamma carbonic anhydrase family protein [Desulfobulbaceae bacterium]
MLIHEIDGKRPQWGRNCFIAENATLVGDIVLGDECSVWFGAVLRGDVNFIRVGNLVNIQDGAIIHCTWQKYPTIVGDGVAIGHRAILHGCQIGNNVLIGMAAIVMDDCQVESGSIIAAGAVVTKGTRVPPGAIFAGIPARKIKDIDPDATQADIRRISERYLMYSGWYQ